MVQLMFQVFIQNSSTNPNSPNNAIIVLYIISLTPLYLLHLPNFFVLGFEARNDVVLHGPIVPCQCGLHHQN